MDEKDRNIVISIKEVINENLDNSLEVIPNESVLETYDLSKERHIIDEGCNSNESVEQGEKIKCR